VYAEKKIVEQRERLPIMFDREEFARRGAELAPVYRQGKPYPHLVIRDLIPASLLEAARDEFERPDTGEDADDPELTTVTRNVQQIKNEISDIDRMGPYARHLLGQLNSAVFVDFLETLTGISGLISDPHYHLAGLHETPHGGHGSIHTDFAYYSRLDLYHRMNVLIYLNSEWPDSYGGQLELWDAKHQKAETVIAPTFGTVVIFETGPKTYHGLPNTVGGPPGTVRRSLAAYFYTANAPRSARRGLRGAVRRPGDGWRVAIPTLTEITHAGLPRSAKQLVHRTKSKIEQRRSS
jgi:Rps23 Pro-64 3,4-dihydroxylase Tpa1-like proline 4-hydroxylase